MNQVAKKMQAKLLIKYEPSFEENANKVAYEIWIYLLKANRVAFKKKQSCWQNIIIFFNKKLWSSMKQGKH